MQCDAFDTGGRFLGEGEIGGLKSGNTLVYSRTLVRQLLPESTIYVIRIVLLASLLTSAATMRFVVLKFIGAGKVGGLKSTDTVCGLII